MPGVSYRRGTPPRKFANTVDTSRRLQFFSLQIKNILLLSSSMGRKRLYSIEEARERQRQQMREWNLRHAQELREYHRVYQMKRQRFSPFRFWKRAWELIATTIEREAERAERRRIHGLKRDKRRSKQELAIHRAAARAKQHLLQGGGKAGKGLTGFMYLQIRRQGFKCAYCVMPFEGNNFETDHKTPIGRGGTNDFGNLHFVCQSCNAAKGTKTDEEYRANLS